MTSLRQIRFNVSGARTMAHPSLLGRSVVNVIEGICEFPKHLVDIFEAQKLHLTLKIRKRRAYRCPLIFDAQGLIILEKNTTAITE